MEFVYVLILVVLLITVRILLWKMTEGVGARAMFLCTIGLFLLYAVIMGGAFYAVCRNAVSVEDCFQRIMVTFLIGNIIVLFMGILYFSVRQKRGLSEIDRMKLEDF